MGVVLLSSGQIIVMMMVVVVVIYITVNINASLRTGGDVRTIL